MYASRHASRRRAIVVARRMLAAASLAALPAVASAQTSWKASPATPGDWFQSANWTSGVPGSFSTATIGNGGTAQITSGAAVAKTVDLGVGSTGTLNHSGGSLALSFAGALQVGNSASGTYLLSNTASLSTDTFTSEYVGYNANGTFTQSGGTNSIGNSSSLYIGYNPTSSGTYQLSAGTLALTIAANVYVGYGNGAGGTLQLSGGTINAGAGTTLYVGYQGAIAGHVVQSGGNVNGTSSLTLNVGGHGGGVSGVGTYELQDGSLAAVFENVGQGGTGTFTQSGGSNTSSQLYVSKGTYTQTGGTNTMTTLFLDAATGGEGRYNLAGGSVALGNLQRRSGGIVDLTGSGSLNYSGIADFSVGTTIHPEQANVTGGATSLLLLPNGANPASYFGSLSTTGVVHVAGTPLNLTTTVVGTGTIIDHVNVAGGSISGGANTAPTLTGGVNVTANGNAVLNTLTVIDAASGMDSGTLTPFIMNVGTTALAGTFTQGGGTNNATALIVSPAGKYVMSGGALITGAQFDQRGTLQFDGVASVQVTGGIADLSSGSIIGPSQADVSVAANSLLLLPAGFDPAASFRSFSRSGLVHNVGTPFTIPAGTTIIGGSRITDQVTVAGTLKASQTAFDTFALTNGVIVPTGGVVDLTFGTITVNDSTSALTGGQLSAGSMSIGVASPGTFTVSSGTVQFVPSIYVGNGAEGSLVVTGGTMNNGNVYVGYTSAGNMSVDGGTGNTTLLIGNGASAPGGVHLSNGTLASRAFVGYRGAGSVTQDGGLATSVTIGDQSTGSGIYTINAGTIRSGLTVGNAGTGTFTQNGGTINDTSTSSLAIGSSSSAVGTFNLNAGQANFSSVTVASSGKGTLNQSGGTFNASSETIGLGSAAQGKIVQSGGSHAVSGQLKIDHGSLARSGGTLSAGNFTMTANATLEFDLNSASPVSAMTIASTAAVNGVLKIDLLDAPLEIPLSPSDSFTLLTAGSAITGSFSNVANGQRLDTIDGDGSFVVNYGAGSAFGANQLVLSNFGPASAPEPAGFALIGAVAGGILLRRRRIRKTH